jgi:hypothetical protein
LSYVLKEGEFRDGELKGRGREHWQVKISDSYEYREGNFKNNKLVGYSRIVKVKNSKIIE